MSDPTNTTPNDETSRGDAMPDPVLPGRAVAALREAFGATRPLPASTDAVVLRTLFERRKRDDGRQRTMRSLQFAAVLGLVATAVYFGNRGREQATTIATATPAQKDRASETKAPTLAELVDKAAPRGTATALSTMAQPAGVTILDAYRLARKVDGKGFVSSGERVPDADDVDQIVAKVVESDVSSLRLDASEVEAIPEAKPESRAEMSRMGPTRVVSYDIKLDTGSRALAAFQVELELSAPDTATITGFWMRGGNHPALQRPPFFNKSIAKQLKAKPGTRVRIPLANFDTGDDLPVGDQQVARVVLSVVGPGHPGLTARLVIAAGPEAVPIPAAVRVVERGEAEVKKDEKK